MNIVLKTKNIEITDSQREYIENKISSLDKFFNNIISARIDVGMESNHHHSGDIYYAHVNLVVPDKTLRVEENEPSIEKAIDKAKDDLQREIKTYKARYNKKGAGVDPTLFEEDHMFDEIG